MSDDPWIYGKIGEPLWEWPDCYGGEQSVMFYERGGPFSPGCPAPATDADWRRLEEYNRQRYEKFKRDLQRGR